MRRLEDLTAYIMKWCIGKGANIGCGNVSIRDSIGVDIRPNATAAELIAEAWFLPFEDKSLDYIVSMACLEHLDRGPITILREWLRCLKSNGIIAIAVPDAEYGIWSMTGDTGKCGKLIKPIRAMEHLHAFDQTTLKMLFEFAGMQVLACERYDRRPAKKEPILICVGRKQDVFE
jgi:predicted SAM-dependent methyltransferase